VAADPYTTPQNPATSPQAVHASTVTDGLGPVVITGTERAAFGEPEPRLTLSQLQVLLREAAAYERAQRPIVLYGPETSAAPQPDIDVRARIPAATTSAVTEDQSHNVWPLVFMISSCTGIGSSFLAAVTSSSIPILFTFAALATWGTATYQLVFVREK
jgi:hypothetical protein